MLMVLTCHDKWNITLWSLKACLLKKHGNVKHQSAIPSECMFSPGHELIRVLKPEVMAPDGGDFFHKQIGRNKIGITFKSLLFQKYQQKHHLSPIQQSSVKALNRSEETLCVMASCRAHAVDHDDTPMALLWLMVSGESRSPSGKFQIWKFQEHNWTQPLSHALATFILSCGLPEHPIWHHLVSSCHWIQQERCSVPLAGRNGRNDTIEAEDVVDRLNSPEW